MGSVTHEVSLTVRNDTIIEEDETFQLQILVSDASASRDVLLAGTSTAIITLQDSDSFGEIIGCIYFIAC